MVFAFAECLSYKRHRIYFAKELRTVFLCWGEFLPLWNRKRFLQFPRQKLHLWSDLSGKWGMDGYFLTSSQRIQELATNPAISIRFCVCPHHFYINVKKMMAISVSFSVENLNSLARIIIHTNKNAVFGGLPNFTIAGNALKCLQNNAMK